MVPKLLLVEASEELAAALCLLVEHEGFHVTQTASGLDALTRAAQERFDFVLLDEETDDLGGAAVLRAISDLAVHTPVLVMSSQASGWQNYAFRHGATACLRKPFDARRLLELIEALRRATTTDIWPGDVRQLSADDLRRLAAMSREELDALPFGAIGLDRERRIAVFNSFEGEASTYFPASVIGAKFSDIAPCSAVKEFAAAIEQGYAGRNVDRVLRFVFPHHGARALVSVRVYCDHHADRLWIFVSKARGEVATNVSNEALGDALPRVDR